MRNLLHKVNLRLDVLHRWREERGEKRPTRVYLLVGMIALLGLTLAIYKILGYRSVERVEIEIVQRHGQTLEERRPLVLPKTQAKLPSPPPSQPTLKEEIKMVARPPEKKKKKEEKVASALPKETQETLKPAPTKEMLPPEKTLEIALFPGKTPGRVMGFLKSKGIKPQEEKIKTTLDLHRVVATSTGKNPARFAKEVKGKTGISPWRLKKGGKTYLVIASLMDEREAKKMERGLKKLGFSPQILTTQRDLTVKALVFSVKEGLWKNMKPQLEKWGAHVLERKALE